LATVVSFGGGPVSVWRVVNTMAKGAGCSSRCEREQLKRCALRHLWKLTKIGLLRRVDRKCVALALHQVQAWARINVVTLPDRDTVQLTIYNSVDLTLVKETRHLTFRKGLNRLEFSWANTLIDPTSVEFRPLSHVDEVEVQDVSFPPRVTNTLAWRI